MRASGRVYTALLTFVQLLDVALLKAQCVHNMIALLLRKLMEQIGEKSTEITATIVDYVDRIDVKVLGTVGLAI